MCAHTHWVLIARKKGTGIHIWRLKRDFKNVGFANVEIKSGPVGVWHPRPGSFCGVLINL